MSDKYSIIEQLQDTRMDVRMAIFGMDDNDTKAELKAVIDKLTTTISDLIKL